MTTARTVRTIEKGDWKASFLKELALCGIVGAACKKVRIGRTTAYKTRDEDSAFAAAWDVALDDAADVMEHEVWRRGTKGVLKPIYQGGKQVGKVREYSDTLLIFQLKGIRPEKYRDRQQIEHIGKDGGALQFSWSAAIAEIADGSAPDSDAPGTDTGA